MLTAMAEILIRDARCSVYPANKYWLILLADNENTPEVIILNDDIQTIKLLLLTRKAQHVHTLIQYRYSYYKHLKLDSGCFYPCLLVFVYIVQLYKNANASS